jgi:hypothetical protein
MENANIREKARPSAFLDIVFTTSSPEGSKKTIDPFSF